MQKGMNKGARGCLIVSSIVGVIYLLSIFLVYLNKESVCRLFSTSSEVLENIHMPIGVLIDCVLVTALVLFSLITIQADKQEKISSNTLLIGMSLLLGLKVFFQVMSPFISIYQSKLVGIKYGVAGVAGLGVLFSAMGFVQVLSFVCFILFCIGMGIWLGRLSKENEA